MVQCRHCCPSQSLPSNANARRGPLLPSNAQFDWCVQFRLFIPTTLSSFIIVSTFDHHWAPPPSAIALPPQPSNIPAHCRHRNQTPFATVKRSIWLLHAIVVVHCQCQMPGQRKAATWTESGDMEDFYVFDYFLHMSESWSSMLMDPPRLNLKCKNHK